MRNKWSVLALAGLMLIAGFRSPARGNPWNGKVVLQAFWWDCVDHRFQTDPDGTGGWYTYLAKLAPRLRDLGFDGVWVPPPCKANSGRMGMGYDLYDHYDLGAKFQKGTAGTRFGNQDEYLRMIAVMHAAGLEVYSDVVLNHMIGGQFDPTSPDLPRDPKDPGGKRVSRDKMFQYAGFASPGRWPKGPLDFHPNPDHGYQDDDDWRQERFGPDICYRGRCSDHQVQEGTSYMRTNAREWFTWFRKQTDVDGFRFDAVKHFPPEVIEDLLFNAMDSGKAENQQRRYFAVGEYVVGMNEKDRLDTWVRETRDRCGALDFAYREALLNMVNARGFFNMGSLPNFQQLNRMKTSPFVNNHDTWRGVFSDSGGNGKCDHTHALQNGDELLQTIDPDDDWADVAHAAAMAVDGSPTIYYEDFFVNYGPDRERADPLNHPVRPYLVNLVWCHQKLNFKDGQYKVRFQGSPDLLVIERSGKAVIGLNDNGAAALTTTVDTDFGGNFPLHDYSGSTSADPSTDAQGKLTVTVPPKSYCIWGPKNIGGGFLGHPRRTTQEFQLADDLGHGDPRSLGYGGHLMPDQYRVGGSIWAAANSPVKVQVFADDPRQVDVRILKPAANGAKADNQGQQVHSGIAGPQAALAFQFTADREGYHQLTAKLHDHGARPVRAYLKVEYEAPVVSTRF